jgi:hypothetical protein
VPLMAHQISQPFTFNNWARTVYSPIEVDSGGREGSVCVCGNGSGRIEVFGDIDIAAWLARGGTLDVAACRGTFDAEGRGNSGMSINGRR